MKAERLTRTAGVEALLFPRNIAIVGASERAGNWAQKVWETLHRLGYEGAVYPVNPRYQTIWHGQRCYPALDALPETPDHVVILVPGEAAIASVLDAGKAGARSATVFASGFGEGGGEASRVLGARMADAIGRTGLAVSGPNCLGNLSAPNRMLTLMDDRVAVLERGPVALFGQSGGIVMALHRTLASRGVAAGFCVTSGNEIGLNAADYIRFFAANGDTRVIACFIEAIRDPDDFLAACGEARAAGKPVVALKLGGTQAGRAAALAHTGSLAGSLACFDAVAGHAGVIRMDTLDEMIEAVEFLAHAKVPAGPRVGAITFSGGLKALIAEAAERSDAVLPELAAPTLARLRDILGVGTSLGNPLDAGFTALASRDAYFQCIDAMLEDPNIDVLLVQEELPASARTNQKAENLRAVNDRVARAAGGAGKPVAVVSMVSYMLTDESRRFRRELPHLPILHEVNKSLRAIGAIGRYGALPRPSPPAPRGRNVPSPEITALLARARPAAHGLTVLDEADSKVLLGLYGLQVPAEEVVRNAEEAAAAAERIGGPVVLKLLSHQVLHKSDVGGVILGLGDGAAMRAAFARLAASLPQRAAGVELERALVARQVTGAIEVVLGVQRDPEVGPVVMFGAGGTLLELYGDVVFGPVPLSAEEADAMIARTRVGRLLDGYRGAAKRDRAAVMAALVALGRLADALRDRLESIDVNPFAVLPAGEGGLALDALVVLRADPGA